MTVQIDQSWYEHPEGIRESQSAGGIVARFEKGDTWIALVREGELPDYILPKGRIEPGESLEQAARREIAEEAGLTDLELVSYLGARSRLNFTRNRWITIHYFLFITRQVEGRPSDTGHNYRCEWFRPNQLPAMFWPEQRQLVEENRGRIQAKAAVEPYTSARLHRPKG